MTPRVYTRAKGRPTWRTAMFLWEACWMVNLVAPVYISGLMDRSMKVTIKMEKKTVWERKSMRMVTAIEESSEMDTITALENLSGAKDKFTEANFDTGYGAVKVYKCIRTEQATLECFSMATYMARVATNGHKDRHTSEISQTITGVGKVR